MTAAILFVAHVHLVDETHDIGKDDRYVVPQILLPTSKRLDLKQAPSLRAIAHPLLVVDILTAPTRFIPFPHPSRIEFFLRPNSEPLEDR